MSVIRANGIPKGTAAEVNEEEEEEQQKKKNQ